MRICIESPYAGEWLRNVEYAKRALKDSLNRGESPFASHLLYPTVLNDDILTERERGLLAAMDWLDACDGVAVYQDYGISPGMKRAIRRAKLKEKLLVYRKIGKNP